MPTGSAGTGQTAASNLQPGQVITNCVKVSYTGSQNASVKLFATAAPTDVAGPGGDTLSHYLHVAVDEGTAGAYGCTGFGGTVTTLWNATTPSAHTDTLDVFPATAGSAINSALASWPTGTSRVYRFTITVDSSIPDAAQGANCSITFNWRAQ